MKNKYVFTAVLLAVILFVGNMLTMAYVRTEQSRAASVVEVSG